MIPEIGHFSLILALILSVYQGVLPLVGAQTGMKTFMSAALPLSLGSALFGTVAIGALAYSFCISDFTVLNVVSNSNTLLPWYYKFSATWGSHEGSVLFWAVTLSWWSAAAALGSGHLPQEMTARTTAVLGWVGAGLWFFTIVTSNPFLRVFPAPVEGADLNPLLQDPGMVLHPPLLYLGYVGFAVPFAFAVASLISGKLDTLWVRAMRPWTTAAWIFLTLGISLGSFWSYYELGWGGWWFWDPVENSSLMPWLTATALMHSLCVTEKRGCFKVWTLLLAILTFSLSLLGTFLVRSGVLTSVHAFATDPERGLFVLAFLILVVGTSLLLFAWRAPGIGTTGNFGLVSREAMLLVNNVLLLVATGVVLLGTLYPLILDAMGSGKISVGPPYFEAVLGPLSIPLILLIGLGPLTRWKSEDPKTIGRRVLWCFLLALLCGAIVSFAMGKFGHWVMIGCGVAFFVIFTAAESVRHQIRRSKGTLCNKLASQPWTFWGMHLAHVGVAVFIIGVTLVKGYECERDVRMYPGDEVAVAEYTFLFEGSRQIEGPNYAGIQGIFRVTRNGSEKTRLLPEKRSYYSSSRMPMTEVSIYHELTGDAYVSLGMPLENGGWTVRAYSKPFVTWIWGGALLMALGGFLAVMDCYSRLRTREKCAGKERK